MAMLSVFWTPLPPFCIAGLYLLICCCWALGGTEKDFRKHTAELDTTTAFLGYLLGSGEGKVFDIVICVDNRVYVTLRVWKGEKL